MKTIAKLSIVLCLSILFSSCFEEECYVEIEVYEPILIDQSKLSEMIRSEESRSISEAHKINFYKNWVFISEAFSGIQVVDITDVSNPIKLKYIAIPGLGDFHIQNDIIYASQYNDLIAMSISNIDEPVVSKRNQNAFYNYSESDGFIYYGSRATGETTLVPCENRYDNGIMTCGNATFDNAFRNQNTTGQAGSLSSFAITDEQALFTISHSHKIECFDLRTEDLTKKSDLILPWGSETLFPYNDLLFVGSRTGMHIIDISDPSSLHKVSTYEHWVSCDPVVVEGDYAFLTTRDGFSCRGGINQLEVINISDPSMPQSSQVVPMFNPHGLAIGENNSLFVCDGEKGLKVFDKSNSSGVYETQQFPGMDALDVIALDDLLIMVSPDDLYFYNHEDSKEMTFLSKLSL